MVLSVRVRGVYFSRIVLSPLCQGRPNPPDKGPRSVSSTTDSPGAKRVVICDYNALLQSVTGLLRMSGYAVYQAYDGEAAADICRFMPDINLLVLNTEGTGLDTPKLVEDVRRAHPGLPVLHIGPQPIPGMPSDVKNLSDTFGLDELLTTVRELVGGGKA
jgi:hypothetical protein